MKRYFAEIIIAFIVIAFALRLNFFAFISSAIRKWLNSAPKHKQEKPSVVYFILIVFLLSTFTFLLIYKVDEIPIPYHADEAGMAYDAKSLAEYGVDRFLYKNPVYFINFGGGMNALYTYLAVPAIKTFGYNVVSVRLPAIILSLVSAMFLTYVIQKEYGNIASVFMMLLFCCIPFSIMHSRWGLESYLFFPMMVISSCFLHRAVRINKIWMYFITGISFGITLYSYAISYVFIPLFLGVICLYLLFIHHIKWTELIALCIPLFLLAIPLLLLLAVNYGFIDEIRTPYISIPKLPVFRHNDIGIGNVLKNLKLNKNNIFYRTLIYDFNPSNVIIKFGTFYYFTLPIIFWGFILCTKRSIGQLKNKKTSLDMMMVWLFLSAFMVSLTLDGINVNRACEMYIPLFYFLCIGILAMYQNRKPAAFAACGLILCLSASFLHYYFVEYPNDMPKIGILNSVDDFRSALLYADNIDKEKPVTIINGDRPQPYIYTLLALNIDPYTFNEGKNQIGEWVLDFNKYHFRINFPYEEYTTDSIYIFMELNEIPENIDTYGFTCKDINAIRVCYRQDSYKSE